MIMRKEVRQLHGCLIVYSLFSKIEMFRIKKGQIRDCIFEKQHHLNTKNLANPSIWRDILMIWMVS